MTFCQSVAFHNGNAGRKEKLPDSLGKRRSTGHSKFDLASQLFMQLGEHQLESQLVLAGQDRAYTFAAGFFQVVAETDISGPGKNLLLGASSFFYGFVDRVEDLLVKAWDGEKDRGLDIQNVARDRINAACVGDGHAAGERPQVSSQSFKRVAEWKERQVTTALTQSQALQG